MQFLIPHRFLSSGQVSSLGFPVLEWTLRVLCMSGIYSLKGEE